MISIETFIFLFFLTVRFIFGDNAGCGSTTVALDKKNYNLTLPVGEFQATTNCVIEITSYKNMDFVMTIPEINFFDTDPCNYNYVAVSNDKGTVTSNPTIKVCDQQKATEAEVPQSKTLFVNIVTQKVDSGKPSVILNFQSIQGKECGLSEIQLSKSVEKIQFPPDGHPFTTETECDITVKGLKDRQFQMTIPEMAFDCNYGYVAADPDQTALNNPKYKKCGTSPVTEAIESKSGILYLKIITTNPAPKFTLQFATVYPECGDPQINLTKDTDVVLPKAQQQFKADTDCQIKVSVINVKSFSMTIPKINFPSDCTKNYVAASTNETSLATTDYKKCGTSPVTDPITSQDVALYLQIKTPNANAETSVTLHFQGGAQRPGQLALVVFFIFHSAKITLH